MTRYGYGGSTLIVDLSSGRVEKEAIEEELVDKFLGGEGFALALAQKYLRPQVDPLSPDNVIVISAGALVGTQCPPSGKITGVAKMPMPAREDGTCYVASSRCGSHLFGVMMKNAGFDNLIITGKAEKPSYISIVDDEVEVHEATDLWGETNVYETDWALREKHGNDCGTLTIGKAGENLVRWSLAIGDKKGTMGRHGFGAVMGAKNLKGLVVRGTKGIKIADPDRFAKKVNELYKRVDGFSFLPKIRKIGYNAFWFVWQITINQGNLPLHEYGYLNRDEVAERFIKAVDSCSACPLGCKNTCEVLEGDFKGERSQTGHFLLANMMMNRLEMRDLNACVKLLKECSDAGLDAMTYMSMADWVTRLYRDGQITREKCGMELSRDFATYLKLLQMVVDRREGLGNILADGYFAVSKAFGVDARKDTVMRGIAKGSDPIYDARFATLDPLRFTYLTNPRPQHAGAHTITTIPSNVPQFPVPLEAVRDNYAKMGIPEEVLQKAFTPVPYYGVGFHAGLLAAENEHARNVYNSLGVCSIYPVVNLAHVEDYAEVYSAATGIQRSAGDLRGIGERIFNLYKALNVREGFTRADDWVEAWVNPRQTPEGVVPLMDYYRTRVITREDVHRLLDDYYEKRGWEVARGIPTKEKLLELGLADAARDLSK